MNEIDVSETWISQFLCLYNLFPPCVFFQKSNLMQSPQRFVELFVVVDNTEVISSL